MRFSHLLVPVLLVALGGPAHAQDPLDFTTADGLCDAREYEAIARFPVSGNSVTVRAEPVRSGSLAASSETDAMVPPFTPVKCFAQTDDLVLVLSEEDGRNYCGWLKRDALLRNAQSTEAPRTGVLDRNAMVCPTLQPMTVTQFCEKTDALGENEPLCEDVRAQDGSIRVNPIETKFLTWNAESTAAKDRTIVPLYSEPNLSARMANDLAIFTVMRVWDLAADENGIFALVGPNQKSVVGWVPVTAGTVWFSKLTAFFAPNGTGPILTAPPGTKDAEVLAEPPPNLDGMFAGEVDFGKYPVLVDGRDAATRQNTTQEPNLKVAFIGAICGAEQTCSKVTEGIERLKNADIVFVIDATKSMQEYFALVADAVDTVASERASTTMRFGAAVYGDFVDPRKRELDDGMQLRWSVELTELFGGDEFDLLPDEELFLGDSVGDKPEAAFAALYQAIETADWRRDDVGLRFIIHLADHGDRTLADEALIQRMKDEKIFYIPIAVRGEFIPEFNTAFLKQTADLVGRLKVGDAQFAVPPVKAYEDGVAQSRDVAATSILKALRGATELQDIVTKEVTAELIGRGGNSVANSNRYPPGFARLATAARQLYGIDTQNVSDSIEMRTLAAPGFVAVPPDGISPDWDFQVALEPRDLGLLIRDFDILCKSMADSNAQDDLSNALRSMIEVLTGDVVSTDNERFYAYFDSREQIPLVTRTILGDGIIDLGEDMKSFAGAEKDRVERYRRETCRTSTLLRLMDADRILVRPYETDADGKKGDLIWDDATKTYSDRNSREFTWTVIGLFDVRTIYLPLSYLPRPYSEN